MSNVALYQLKGWGCSMTVYEDRCVISGGKNALSAFTGRALSGNKEFYYSDLTAVQYKEASTLINGFIQFEYPGSRSGDNFGSENSFIFAKQNIDPKIMREVFEFIQNKIREAKERRNTPVGNAFSPAEELQKFKGLLDAGIISQEEFDAKKKQLLGL